MSLKARDMHTLVSFDMIHGTIVEAWRHPIIRNDRDTALGRRKDLQDSSTMDYAHTDDADLLYAPIKCAFFSSLSISRQKPLPRESKTHGWNLHVCFSLSRFNNTKYTGICPRLEIFTGHDHVCQQSRNNILQGLWSEPGP